MTIPFNLEQAKSGKLYKTTGGDVVGISFLAVTKYGYIVGETSNGTVWTFHPDCLVMHPVKKKYYANLYFNTGTNSAFITDKFFTEEDAVYCADVHKDNDTFTYIKTIEFDIEE